MTDHYFVNARMALQKGLCVLDFKKNDELLVPDYICESIIFPIYELKIKIVYYSLNDKLLPDWKNLNNLLSPKTKAILMVNFFGNVLDLEKYVDFSKKNLIYLIEDNAHGYGGKYKRRKLGSFGDIGISSPRKLMPINYGGILHLNNLELIKKNEKILNIQYNYKGYNRSKKLYNFKKFLPSGIKSMIRKIIFNRPRYENQDTFRGVEYFPKYISSKDIIKIKTFDWEENRKLRNEKYKKFENFCKKNNLKLLFDNFDQALTPWCCGAYVDNQTEAVKFFDYGWRNNIKIFSWPTLPEELCNQNSKSLNRWKKLIFFSTD